MSRATAAVWHRAAVIAALAVGVSSAWANDFQGATHLTPFEEDTIQYGKTPATGPIPRLQARLDSGETKLRHDDTYGYLLSLLDELKISRASQMLVFSKTSFQRERIGPKAPRAVFFNDDVYVGFVQGSPLLEISSVDPKLGGTFFTLEQKPADKPRFVRTDQCLECHASAKTMGVPGHLVRSFATDDIGLVDLNTGTSLVNHRTPLAERWGGWYVTGTHGDQPHRGNLVGKAAFERQEREPNYLGNLTNLSEFFAVSNYPAGSSDIVALMVLEHQTHAHNFLTRLNYEARMALATYGHLNYLKNVIEAFLKYWLFVDEAPLTAPIRGQAAYVEWFERLGPKDAKGRSLRQFDLQTRLFKFPCSYLIYSEAFDHLPDAVKALVYQRLFDILSGKETKPEFRKIPSEMRQAVLEIVRDTKHDLPDYWRTDGSSKLKVQSSREAQN